MKLERAPDVKISSEFDLTGKTFNELYEILNHINEEYYYWDRVKRQPRPNSITTNDLWALTKYKRDSNRSHLKFGNHKFSWNINNTIQGILHYLDMNICGNLSSSNVISNEDKHRYLVSSVMEEAIASSQIEGAATTRARAKEMLRKNQKPTNKSELMIANNYSTIQKIIEIKDQPINKENLLALHKLVTAGTMDNPAEEGALRTDDSIDVIDTTTGEVVYHPPAHEEVEGMLNDLFTFFNENKEAMFIHPLIKASIIHFMIGYIHPFADGNGRTARALFYWYLLKQGYWLTEYLSISRLILVAKAKYARAFLYTETDDNDLTYFILFNLKTMKQAFEQLRLYIERKNEEKANLSRFIQIAGISYKQALILEWFYKEPGLILTVKETETRLAMSSVGARKNLMQLVDEGYLTLIYLDKKTNGFIKSHECDELIQQTRQQN